MCGFEDIETLHNDRTLAWFSARKSSWKEERFPPKQMQNPLWVRVTGSRDGLREESPARHLWLFATCGNISARSADITPSLQIRLSAPWETRDETVERCLPLPPASILQLTYSARKIAPVPIWAASGQHRASWSGRSEGSQRSTRTAHCPCSQFPHRHWRVPIG